MIRTILIFLFIPYIALLAQNADNHIREGNKEYEKGNYEEAETNFRKALEEEHRNEIAKYNLGDALYKRKNYDNAIEEFLDVTTKGLDKESLAKAYHNLGNSYLQANKYEQSIEAYKNSLKNNPKDMDTKYNLEYAKQMLQKQQQQKQDNKDNKDKNKDQNKQDKQNQDQKDQNKQDKQNSDQKNNDDQKKGQQNQQQGDQGDKKDMKDQQAQQGKPQQISKKDAERMLQALQRQEANMLREKQKKNTNEKKYEKNW